MRLNTTTTTTTITIFTTTMNFINKGIMTGRAKLSRIIHVKPCHLDDKNKENIDISATKPNSPPPPPLLTTKLPTSLTTSVEDLLEEPLPPSKSTPSPNPRRSRSLDRLTASGTSLSDRRNSYFDVKHHTHTHSLGSPELAPVFTTTYRTVFNTLNTNPTMNGTSRNFNNNNSSKNSMNGGGNISSKFKFQKSPVKRRAKW